MSADLPELAQELERRRLEGEEPYQVLDRIIAMCQQIDAAGIIGPRRTEFLEAYLRYLEPEPELP